MVLRFLRNWFQNREENYKLNLKGERLAIRNLRLDISLKKAELKFRENDYEKLTERNREFEELRKSYKKRKIAGVV